MRVDFVTFFTFKHNILTCCSSACCKSAIRAALSADSPSTPPFVSRGLAGNAWIPQHAVHLYITPSTCKFKLLCTTSKLTKKRYTHARKEQRCIPCEDCCCCRFVRSYPLDRFPLVCLQWWWRQKAVILVSHFATVTSYKSVFLVNPARRILTSSLVVASSSSKDEFRSSATRSLSRTYTINNFDRDGAWSVGYLPFHPMPCDVRTGFSKLWALLPRWTPPIGRQPAFLLRSYVTTVRVLRLDILDVLEATEKINSPLSTKLQLPKMLI